MSALIHKTATIEADAQIDDTVCIGAYTVIGPNVSIGAHSKIGSHVVIKGDTTIGSNNQIFQFSSIGDIPQDKKYHGEKAVLVIGNNNVIREYCSINTGADKTIIGNNNCFMMNTHIAHDCRIGNDIVFVNGAMLAGHVEVRDYAIISASTKIHQFCRIGEYSFCRDASISQDVTPYVIAIGSPSPKTYGLNKIGLQRHGFSKELIDVLHRCYRQLIRNVHNKNETMQQIDVNEYATVYPEVKNLIDFIKSSKRGIVR